MDVARVSAVEPCFLSTELGSTLLFWFGSQLPEQHRDFGFGQIK
jgi:hypothetical protein